MIEFNQDKLLDKELGIAYWFVTNKILLKKILIIFLIFLNIFLISFIITSLINNLILKADNSRIALNNYIYTNSDYARLRQIVLPQPIQLGQLQTFANVDKTDIMVEVFNPNQRWYATFDYQFKLGQNNTAVRSNFIMPGEKKRLIDLRVTNGNLATEVVLSNIKWQKRIDYFDIYRQRLVFDIKEIQYIPVKELGIGQEVPVSRVSFLVENLSAYSYNNVNFLLFLTSGGQIVAINQVPSGQLLSTGSKRLDINFFQQLPKIDSIEIIPDVNILDDKSFIKV